MLQLAELSLEQRQMIKVVLTDIDDTVTTDGRLTGQAYVAMERLREAGFLLIPVTGRCAGWCDHIARMWPVDAVVGENGAFYLRYDHNSRTLHKHYSQPETIRMENAGRLATLRKTIMATLPGITVTSDQHYRETDLAIDIAEDVTKRPATDIRQIVDLMQSAGATAKVSSIHINCWLGDHSKLSTTLTALHDCFGIGAERLQREVLFVGDSPNDSTMFAYFEHSVGVANVLDTLEYLTERPTYITNNKAGSGFVELVDHLLTGQ
ncbi:MAG: HAD-IIB family hydrolase [Thiolinea sp.]